MTILHVQVDLLISHKHVTITTTTGANILSIPLTRVRRFGLEATLFSFEVGSVSTDPLPTGVLYFDAGTSATDVFRTMQGVIKRLGRL